MFFTFVGRGGSFRFLLQGTSLWLAWLLQPCNLLQRRLQTCGNSKAASVPIDAVWTGTTGVSVPLSLERKWVHRGDALVGSLGIFFFLVLEKLTVLHGRSLMATQNIYIYTKHEPHWWPGGKNKCGSSCFLVAWEACKFAKKGLALPLWPCDPPGYPNKEFFFKDS